MALAKCQVSGNSTSFHMILLRIMKFDLFRTSEWKKIVLPLGLVHNAPNPTLVVILLYANLVMMETRLLPFLNLNRWVLTWRIIESKMSTSLNLTVKLG